MKTTILILALLSGCAKQLPPNVSEGGGQVATLHAPPPEAFEFGPGDVLEIRVWRQPEMDMQVKIAPDGTISVPILGSVQAAGRTHPELVAELEAGLSDYYTDPQVSVNIGEVTNQKVFVLGEVRNPAVLQIENDLSIVEALTRTGGINPDARTDNVLLIRSAEEELELYTVRVDDIFGLGDASQMIFLQRGDIVVVPSRTIVSVERFFRRIQGMLAPFVAGSAIYRNSSQGDAQGINAALLQ